MSEPPIVASVVVPTLGRPDVLGALLRALATQTLGADRYEVIISVDGARTLVASVVEAIRPDFRLRVVDGPRRGRAAACNAGLAVARGEIVIVLDDDMEPAPAFLAAHVAAHPTPARRGVVGAAPVRTTADDLPVAHYVAAKFARHLRALAAPDHRWTLRDFYTGNFSIRRTTLLEVGPFDEGFGEYGNEDLELFWRLRGASVEVTFSGAALAWQRYTKTLDTFARDNWEKGRTAVQLAGKYPDAVRELKLSSYRSGALPARLARQTAVAVGRACPWSSQLVIAGARVFERAALPGRETMYQLVADYLYWLGAFAALAENRARGRGLPALP